MTSCCPPGTTLQIEADVLVAHVLAPQVEAEPEVEAEVVDGVELGGEPAEPDDEA